MRIAAIATIFFASFSHIAAFPSLTNAALPGLTAEEEKTLTFEEYKTLRDLLLKDIPFHDKETVHTFTTMMAKPGDSFVDLEAASPMTGAGWQKWDLSGIPEVWLRQFADKGDPFAQANLGYYYIMRKDWCLGHYWLAQAARKSHTGAMYWVTFAYDFGFGVERLTDGRKNAFLWSLVWPMHYLHTGKEDIDSQTLQYGIGTLAERYGINSEDRDSLVALFKRLDISELPAPPKTSCPFD